MSWRPDSWRDRPAAQQAQYPDPVALNQILGQLALLPPLVTSWEIEELKQQLAAAGRGEAFMLQGGDCAESFADCQGNQVADKLKILLQMSLVLVQGLQKRVIRVGRIAGQYAKPRSADLETLDGVSLPSYRGDLINGQEFTPEARLPDPVRLLRGYGRAAMTLNFIRSLADCGFADLHHPERWNLDFVGHSDRAGEYRGVLRSLEESLRFMDLLGCGRSSELSRVQFFTSHEGLHLLFEQAVTRQVPHRPGWYDLSTHLPWIGVRTGDLNGAHVEFFRGVCNPVGIKIGNQMTSELLVQLMERLNPADEPGKLVLIHRFGARQIQDRLPPLVEAVRRSGRSPVWVADPMHGNGETTPNGYKTRRFDNILAELDQAFDIHRELGSHLGGVHFELTGEDVTECMGGARGLCEADLERAYRTQVDPRLNAEQALEMAMEIVRKQRP